jgi:coatomer protein complex subunit gamma
VEATEVFFATTKLFQSKDAGLRRMVYLMIKELSPSADEVGNCYLCYYAFYGMWE